MTFCDLDSDYLRESLCNIYRLINLILEYLFDSANQLALEFFELTAFATSRGPDRLALCARRRKHRSGPTSKPVSNNNEAMLREEGGDELCGQPPGNVAGAATLRPTAVPQRSTSTPLNKRPSTLPPDEDMASSIPGGCCRHSAPANQRQPPNDEQRGG